MKTTRCGAVRYLWLLQNRAPEDETRTFRRSRLPPTSLLYQVFVQEGVGYATLTDIIYQAWAGLTAREYKHLKGLHQENLRDNMTNEELVMNMLAELTTTNITKEEHPHTMSEHARVAVRGGSVAKVAKEAFEAQTGKKVVSSLNMKQYLDSQQPTLDFENQDPQDEE